LEQFLTTLKKTLHCRLYRRPEQGFLPDAPLPRLPRTLLAEWKIVILLAFYAGLRLGDAVRLDWRCVDFSKGLLTFKAKKTKRIESLPIHPKLRRHLDKIAGDTAGAISPTLARQSIAGRSGLSRQFLDIVNEAGLGAPEGKKLDGNRRRFTAKTFHSLRHGFVWAMANGGVKQGTPHESRRTYQ
jgi:integrase